MSDAIELRATTVTVVGETRVGCGNLWTRERPLDDGTTVDEMSARLSLGDDVVYAWGDTTLEIDGTTYRVTEIEEGSGPRGSVFIEPTTASPSAP